MSPKKQLFDLEVKSQGPTKIIMVRETPPYCHAPTYQISLTYLEKQKSYGPDKLRWEEAEEEAEAVEEEKNQTKTMSPFVRRENIINCKMSACSPQGRAKPKTIKLIFVASQLSTLH
jgi:hypothetical protein